MTPTTRIAIVLAAVAVAAAAFVLLRPATEEGPPTSPTDSDQPTALTAPETLTAPGTTGRRSRGRNAPGRGPTIRVEGGHPVGDPSDLTARKGETVRFTVTSDVEDEVHLHGYDRTRRAGPDRQAVFSLRADIEGIFEIELEQRGTRIATLTVEP